MADRHLPPEDAAHAQVSDALEAVIARFRRLIVGIGHRYGLPEADVDDVVQEVRIRLWRSRGDPATLEALGSAYVQQAAITAALDVLRRRRARRTGVDAVAELPSTLAASTPGPDALLEQDEAARRVYEAVGALLPARRAVVRLHLGGYDRREIARVLHCSEGAVRNLLSRGLADLRRTLGRTDIGPGGAP